MEKLEIVAGDLRVRHGATVSVDAFDFADSDRHAAALDRAIATSGEMDVAIICHGSLGNQAALTRRISGPPNRSCASIATCALSFLTLLANRFESQGRGTLVVISSVAGDRGRQSNYVYGTAKAALNTFTQGLRNRLYARGVNVLTVKPGFVDTPMTGPLEEGFPVRLTRTGRAGHRHSDRASPMRDLYTVVLAVDHAADQADPGIHFRRLPL